MVAASKGLKSHNVTGKYNIIECKILYIMPMVVRMICAKRRARQKSTFILKGCESGRLCVNLFVFGIILKVWGLIDAIL